MPETNRFTLPPEWALHEATWLAWPKDPNTWIAGIEQAETAYVNMIKALAPGERVDLLHPPGGEDRITRILAENDIHTHTDQTPSDEPPSRGVRLHEATYVDSWIRDTGPLTITRGTKQRLALDWRFNAWGNKYEALEKDDALAQRIAKATGIETLRVDTVLEGGAIDVDGTGRLLTTEACLLNKNRGDRSRAHLEAILELLLGVDDILWLGHGLPGDDTDGHVDTITRFVQPGHVVTCKPPTEEGKAQRALEDNLDRLHGFKDEERLDDVTVLPLPEPVTFEGKTFHASYANFYIGNDAVLVPTFDDPADEKACSILQQAFPKRRIVTIPARALIVGYGACHCLTMQIPSTGPATSA